MKNAVERDDRHAVQSPAFGLVNRESGLSSGRSNEDGTRDYESCSSLVLCAAGISMQSLYAVPRSSFTLARRTSGSTGFSMKPFTGMKSSLISESEKPNDILLN